MLYLSNICKNYGNFQAVDNLTLHIPKGDLFGFVGPNGAGKTTTIRITCGLLKKTSGTVHINGINADGNMDMIKKSIGYVPDFFGVYDNLKVKEYMDFYGSMYGMYSRDIAKIADDLLDLVNLADKKEVYVDTLSRGMKQRLCVARALIHNPELLILDEPSSGLDPRARIEMKELLMNLNSMGKTIVISSHILSELSEMCTSIGIMNHGHLVTAGKIDDVMNSVNAGNRIHVKVISSMDDAIRVVKENAFVKLDSVRENEIIVNLEGNDENISQFMKSLVMNDVMITDFHKEEGNLENIFMALTGGNMEGGVQ